MNFKNKIFCALDFSELEQTIQFTNKIKNHIGGIKIGLEFFCKNGPAGVERLKEFELPIFLDLKLHDIPNTVTRALRNLINLSPAYLTVHLNGGKRMIEGLIEFKKKTKLIGVTILTSLDNKALKEIGYNKDVKKLVLKQAKLASKAKLDAIVCSPLEIKIVKKVFKKEIITPGIRLPGDKKGDKSRVMTPKQAFKNGASSLVMGRSLTKGNIKKNIRKLIRELK